jgi:hypothetical protein
MRLLIWLSCDFASSRLINALTAPVVTSVLCFGSYDLNSSLVAETSFCRWKYPPFCAPPLSNEFTLLRTASIATKAGKHYRIATSNPQPIWSVWCWAFQGVPLRFYMVLWELIGCGSRKNLTMPPAPYGQHRKPFITAPGCDDIKPQ